MINLTSCCYLKSHRQACLGENRVKYLCSMTFFFFFPPSEDTPAVGFCAHSQPVYNCSVRLADYQCPSYSCAMSTSGCHGDLTLLPSYKDNNF